MVGQKFYHIDEPNQPYEVVRVDNSGHLYIVLFHPSFVDAKHIHPDKIGSVIFSNREDCLEARVERAWKVLDNEIICKERKI